MPSIRRAGCGTRSIRCLTTPTSRRTRTSSRRSIVTTSACSVTCSQKMQQDAGWRGNAARSFHFDVGQWHGRQQRPQPRSAASILLAGSGGGRLKGGRHISAGKKVPLSANLHLSLLQKADIEWIPSATAPGPWTSEMRMTSRRALLVGVATCVCIGVVAWLYLTRQSQQAADAAATTLTARLRFTGPCITAMSRRRSSWRATARSSIRSIATDLRRCALPPPREAQPSFSFCSMRAHR